MIFIMSKQENKIVANINTENNHELALIDDTYKESIELGTDTYAFTFKKHENAEKIKLGDYVVVQDKMNANQLKVFEMITKEESKNDISIYSESASIDMINETIGSYTAEKSYSLEHYFNLLAFDSGWELKTNITTHRKLEWSGIEKVSKRLRDVAKWFNAELYYTVEVENNKIKKRYVHIVEKIGKKDGVYLLDADISNLKKTEDISELATAVHATSSEENVSLNGYHFDDGRYFLSGETLCDRTAGRRWKRQKFSADIPNYDEHGYIVYRYESTAKTQAALLQEALEQLKKRNEPHTKYEITVENTNAHVSVGDTVRISANNYHPKIKIEARITGIERSLCRNKKIKLIVESGKVIKEELDDKVKKISKLLKEQQYKLKNIPPILNLKSSNGTVFKDSNIQTKLIATVTKNGIDVTTNYTYKWKRESRYSAKKNSIWNTQHTNLSNELAITIDDVEQEATFICEVYKDSKLITQKSIVIKDFIVGKYKQSTPPKNAEKGALWTDTSKEPPILKTLVGDEWVPVIQDLTNTLTKEEFKTERDAQKQRLIEVQERYTKEITDVIKTTVEIQSKLETKLTDKDLEDLRGKLTDTQKDYEKLLKTQSIIEGLEERVTAFEVNVQQSQALINALSTYFSFSEDGVLTGRKGSTLQTLMTNDKLSFLDGGKEVAYISNQQLYILSGVFLSTLVVGNHIFEKLGTEYTLVNWVGGGANGNI